MDIMGNYEEKSAPIDLTETEQQQFNKLMSEVTVNGMTVSQAIRSVPWPSRCQGVHRQEGSCVERTALQVQLDFNNMLNEYKTACCSCRWSTPMFLSGPDCSGIE